VGHGILHFLEQGQWDILEASHPLDGQPVHHVCSNCHHLWPKHSYLVRLIWALAAARGTGREWLLADGVQSLGQLDSERHTEGEAINNDQGRLLILNAAQTWDPCKRPHGVMQQIAPIIRCRDIPNPQAS
jgi:hypothetical protein